MNLNSFLENRRYRLLILFLLIAFQTVSAQSKYVKKYKPMADSLSAIYHVPTSVMLGIAIIESGAGKSRNCKLLNNHFGVKGKNNLVKTHGIKSSYKQYADGRASYVAFCKLMTRKKFYQKLKGKKDHKLWLDAISKAGYSTVPDEWKKNIIAAIRKHKLAEVN
ncbi:MAG TPA: glucosaminidase domain-containing protein [Chitinophagaceae bacterium]|nr:glucosaminidase domain-containing protein [Chitinophagaceae bacterium]